MISMNGPVIEEGQGAITAPSEVVDDDLRAYAPTLRFAIPVPTRRMVVIAAACAMIFPFAGVGFNPSSWLLFVAVWIVLGCLWLLDIALAPDPSALLVYRQTPSPAVLGNEATVTWRLHNPTTKRMRLRFSDSPAPSLRGKQSAATLVVKPGEEGGFSYTICPVRRGAIPIEAPVIRSVGVLGLGIKQTGIAYGTTINVKPAFPSRKMAELRLDDAKRLFIGQRAIRRSGESAEFDYLREYVPGDEVRHINWAATARSQQLIVEQTRAERNQQIVVLLDHSRLSVPTVRRFTPPETVYDGLVVDLDVVEAERAQLDHAPRLDQLLDAVMALGYVSSGLGDRIGLIAYAHTVTKVLAPDTGKTHREAINRFVADLHPGWDEPDHIAAASWLMGHWSRRSLVIVMTDLAPESVRLSLIPALGRLTSRHQVMVAALGDPTVSMWAQATPVDEAGAMRQVAARRVLEERHLVAQQIRRMGVEVLDVQGGLLATRLIDHYLDADELSTQSRMRRSGQH